MQILQWIVAAGTAVFVATIGYFQWRTAQQKVVLELFDRRHEIYREIREAVARITGSGRADLDIEIKVAEALERARFFFGIEVIRYLEQFVEAVRDLNCYGQEATATQNAIEISVVSLPQFYWRTDVRPHECMRFATETSLELLGRVSEAQSAFNED